MKSLKLMIVLASGAAALAVGLGGPASAEHAGLQYALLTPFR